MGRPYNTGDPALNLSMVEKLINMDVQPIPMDFLPLEDEKITNDYNKMYWPNGQKILAAASLFPNIRVACHLYGEFQMRTGFLPGPFRS